MTTFRGEGAYLDGRRPSSVTYVSSLAEDLSRRDFTMNAVGYDPIADTLTDPFDGRGDLARRLIRAVGDPVQRFREDGLRPMRAVRQATQLGFTIDPPTLAAIGETLEVFRKVSAERIRDELLKLLAAPRPSHGLELMRDTGLMDDVLPELLEGVGVTQNRFHKFDVYQHTLSVVDNTRGDRATLAIVRLGALLHDVGKPRARQPREGAPGEFSFFKHEYVGADMADAIARRLKLSVADRERVVAMVANHMFFYSPDWTDGTVRRFVRRVGSDALPALFALREGDIAGRGFGEDPDVELGELRRRIAEVATDDAALRITDLAIDGKDGDADPRRGARSDHRRRARAAARAGAGRPHAERRREAGRAGPRGRARRARDQRARAMRAATSSAADATVWTSRSAFAELPSISVRRRITVTSGIEDRERLDRARPVARRRRGGRRWRSDHRCRPRPRDRHDERQPDADAPLAAAAAHGDGQRERAASASGG